MYGNLNPRRQIVCPKTIQNVQHMTNGRPCGMTRTMFTEHMFFIREKSVYTSPWLMNFYSFLMANPWTMENLQLTFELRRNEILQINCDDWYEHTFVME